MLKAYFNEKALNQLQTDHNYNMRGDSDDSIGRITTNANQKDKSPKYLSKKEKQFRQIIEKMTSDLYNSMSLWSLSDFQTHGNAYRDWLHQQANEAYEDGDYDTFKSLTEQAEKMYDKEQKIINDLSLTDEEKKLALIELWEEQDQALVEEFITEYKDLASDVVLKKDNSYDDGIENPKVATPEENTMVVKGLNI